MGNKVWGHGYHKGHTVGSIKGLIAGTVISALLYGASKVVEKVKSTKKKNEEQEAKNHSGENKGVMGNGKVESGTETGLRKSGNTR